jgi:hypothetical protein
VSLFDRLVKQLADRGLSVVPGDEPGQLVLKGPKDGKTPEIVRAVKAFKPQLLERFGVPPAPAPKSDTPAVAADPEDESTGRRR